MQVRLLGPVDVAVAGGPRPVNGLRRKAVLAALALHDGQVVSTGRLVDVVWGESAPATVVNSLQAHISYLRGVLGSRAAILARPPGYLLNLGGDGTDARAAERLLRQGRQAADPALGVRDLREALALWRGRPLADVTGSAWLEEQSQRLDLLADQVRRALFEARLAAGEHAEIVPGLEQMAAANPLDEQVHGQLMLAFYRCGRQADALAVFGRLRAALAEQLGIDPGPALRDLQTAILRQDQALAAPARSPAVPLAAQPGPVPVPAQLPPAVPGFAGRSAELARLDAVLAQAERERPAGSAAVVISAVSGTAGVGKTTLAVHWAHQVAPQFPDGQLYVNLRGFDPGGQPAEPAEALRGFLDALGVPQARIPDGVPARAGLYRSLVAGKRVLVVLDNASDPGQVRPLLPGSPGCLVIVTSRSDLAGLVAAEGACPVSLDLLTTAEASDLLARRLGPARVASEPEAVAEIIGRCARLPLALAIAAARAAARPGFPLAAIAAELRGATATLDPFGGTDLATDVRAVFSWSCRLLSGGAVRLFRLLGLHPGPDISVPAAASLASVTPQRARVLLAELTGAHLLSEHAPGRYACHDLLRAYAAEQARMVDPDQDRNAAIRRVLDHYLHTGHRAAIVLAPYLDPLTLATADPTVIVGEFATGQDALGWLASEHAPLLAAVHRAAAAGFSTHAWQLAWALSTLLLRRGLWDQVDAVCEVGLDAARRTGDAAGQARCLHRLANRYAKSGRIHESVSALQQALRHFESVGDLANRATIHTTLLWVAVQQQRPADALSHALRAQELFSAAGNRAGQTVVLADIGYCRAMLGDYQQALACCEQALAEVQEAGDRGSEASVWDSLGYVHHERGDHQQAIICYQRAVDICRERTDRYNEAAALNTLGDVHHSAGDTRAARRAWTQALRILDQLGHPDSDPVRAKLSSHVSLDLALARSVPAQAGNSLAHPQQAR
jgi:DNA-binding SARP family transcriptional activator